MASKWRLPLAAPQTRSDGPYRPASLSRIELPALQNNRFWRTLADESGVFGMHRPKIRETAPGAVIDGGDARYLTSAKQRVAGNYPERQRPDERSEEISTPWAATQPRRGAYMLPLAAKYRYCAYFLIIQNNSFLDAIGETLATKIPLASLCRLFLSSCAKQSSILLSRSADVDLASVNVIEMLRWEI